MLAQQRHLAILDRLRDDGGVRVTELARVFKVTEETIRRDLERLDREGKLIRIHGGAMPVRGVTHDQPFNIRRAANLDHKQAIAQVAVRFVEEGAVIGLDASSTVHELARVIPDRRLTVVTNSLPASSALARCENLQVVSTGGILDPASWSWTGSLAEHALDRINIDRFFMSSIGLDLERGLSEIDDHQARVKRRFMDVAEEVFLLLDHSKIGKKSVVNSAGLDEVHTVITDSQADGEAVAALRERGLRVEIAP
jgi:DeoR family L-fucose operon activator